MKSIFIDTGAFLAKELARDQFYQQARAGWAELVKGRATLFSSEHVLAESATLLARRSNYAFAADWGTDILKLKQLHWLQASKGDLAEAFTMMRQFADQGVSFTDSLSFVCMRRERIKYVFGFDRHFTAAGFRLWPG